MKPETKLIPTSLAECMERYNPKFVIKRIDAFSKVLSRDWKVYESSDGFAYDLFWVPVLPETSKWFIDYTDKKDEEVLFNALLKSNLAMVKFLFKRRQVKITKIEFFIDVLKNIGCYEILDIIIELNNEEYLKYFREYGTTRNIKFVDRFLNNLFTALEI